MMMRGGIGLLLVVVALLAGNVAATIIPAEKEHVLPLDGTWRFRLEQGTTPATAPTSRPVEPFFNEDFHEGADWHDLAVPGNWESAGFSPATYDQPDAAVGQYRLRFDVPADWEGRGVKINFDGGQNAAEVWLNRQPAT